MRSVPRIRRTRVDQTQVHLADKPIEVIASLCWYAGGWHWASLATRRHERSVGLGQLCRSSEFMTA
jgi:hypothetical protein